MTNVKKVYYHKGYVFFLALTAACSYGFKITHQTMGIDDTPYAYYFEEGLAAVVGRWVLFVLNKVFSISEFAPFVTDLVAVLILAAAVTVWGALFYSILGDRVPRCGYWLFSCIFLSCPLIAEVFTYFLHNGIAIGYLACGISLYSFREILELINEETGKNGWKRIWNERFAMRLALALLMLTLALGCYESFMIVWLTGVLMVLGAERLTGGKKTFVKLCVAAVTAACSVLLRALVIKAVIGFFGLSYLQDAAVQRSFGELLGWIMEPGAKAEFAMILKRLFVMYGVFGNAYYPIRIFVSAAVVLCIYSIWKSISQRDGWILVLQALCFGAAFLLAVVEGKATLYRSAQFLPLFCGYGSLIAASMVWEIADKVRSKSWLAKGLQGIFLLGAVSVLWNQCTDINRWFYVDYLKYEYAKEYMENVAYAIEAGYDCSKPVVFTGNWENPEEIVDAAYVDYGSETFFRMKNITDRMDEHLLEKFYRNYGVWVAQTPELSVISWGKHAFGTDEQLIAFLRFHGHEFRPLTDEVLYEEAENYAIEYDLPHFPQKGSIVEREQYILVHF